MSNSRRASNPTTKKKNARSPELIQWRRSSERLAAPRCTESSVRHVDSYDDSEMLAQTSAAMVAPSRTAALPVSVRRKSRSGVRTPRAQAERRDQKPPAWTIAPLCPSDQW
jgi:hypothetical protein